MNLKNAFYQSITIPKENVSDRTRFVGVGDEHLQMKLFGDRRKEKYPKPYHLKSTKKKCIS